MEIDRQIPFSIYLQLDKNSQADFEVVSKASLELIQALREVTSFAAPEAVVQVLLQNGEEGSLRLNTWLKLSKREESGESKIRLSDAVIVGLVMFLLETTAGHYADKLLDLLDQAILNAIEVGGNEEEIEAEAAQVRKAIEGMERNQIGTKEVRRFFSQIKEDESIIGVGIAGDHEQPPKAIVPRSEFLARSSEPKPEDDEGTRRRFEEINILLVQPRLLGDEKAWRFVTNGIEFSARIEDREFVEQTLSGKRHIPLVQGVWMNVTMRYDEKKVNGVWVVLKRTVLQVHKAWSKEPQGSLFEPGNQTEDE